MPVSPNWLARYRAGQRDLVWHELRQLGSAVRKPGLATEAQLVCDEMATRARHNVDLIISRLTSAGYRFHLGDDDATPTTPHVLPSATAGEHAHWLEERFGPVPLALLSWIRLVGDVWLVGTHPEWPESAAADPLVIEAEGSRYPGYSIRSYLEEAHEDWQDRAAEDPATGPFLLRLAPDRFHKQGRSGGGPYGVIVPDAGAEGIFVAGTTMPFVSYLNWVFLSGGFPWPDRFTYGSKVQWTLGKGLLPL
jgi:hypothetical protein